MEKLSLFGFASVLLMMVAYALESKAAWWTLVFALGCFSSALYGWLAGTLPFAVVETVWGVVALAKWFRRPSATQ